MNFTSTLLKFICVCFASASLSNAFSIFNRKRDCSMSSWSAWSDPFGFPVVTRERAVLRHPTNGGKACPKDLIETKSTTTKLTVKDIATSMNTHFVRRGQTLSKGGRNVGQKRDLLIIIDSSGSISSSNFQTTKNELARLIGLLCPSPDPFSRNYQKAALIQYSSNVVEVFDFDDKSNTFQVKSAINSLPYMGRSTCTATAFKKAEGMLNIARGMRDDPDVKQEVLILTDGRSNCGGNAIQAAISLQNKADVFGLMIGSFSTAGHQELVSYVSGPINQHLFAIQNFQNLTTLVNEIESQLSQPNAPKCAPFDI